MYVYIVLVGVFLLGLWRILESFVTFSDARREPEPAVCAPRFQIVVWVILLLGAISVFVLRHEVIATLTLVLAVMLPAVKRKKTPKGVEDWPDTQPSIPASPRPDPTHH